MKFVIYEIDLDTTKAATWAWHALDTNGNTGLSAGTFPTEGQARDNLTQTLEAFGVDPATVTIEVLA